MTRLRRRSGVAYRVYDEEEYLAGADALAARKEAPSAVEPTHGRRLQRFAGAAALTGAVGTVGGVVGLVGLRTHARALDRRELAQRAVPSVRAPARGHARPPAHTVRRRIAHPPPPRHWHARRGARARVSRGPAPGVGASARAIAVSVPPVGVARDAPAEARAGSRAQSEFGFER
jgi:hypothetical protein